MTRNIDILSILLLYIRIDQEIDKFFDPYFLHEIVDGATSKDIDRVIDKLENNIDASN